MSESFYEKRDTKPGLVARLGLYLTLFTVVVIVLMFPLYHMIGNKIDQTRKQPTFEMTPKTVSPNPQLEVHPNIELHVLQQEEEQKVNSYGWVDQEKKIVRIPLEKAIERSLKKGFQEAAS